MASGLDFRHVDVFSAGPYSGNGLVVFFGGTRREAGELLVITREMRQFESIFVEEVARSGEVEARIFTVEEELPFAGHPLIGAAAALHERHAREEPTRAWTFVVDERRIEVTSRREGTYYSATMDQGTADLAEPLSEGRAASLAGALGLRAADVSGPMQVLSTGLPYLIVPVTDEGLARARIAGDDLASELGAVGARFVYVLQPERREGRTWDNAGAVEDVATGSAAGPAAAYLREHGFVGEGDVIALRQGRFVGRPSEMAVRIAPEGNIHVGGSVAGVASGRLD